MKSGFTHKTFKVPSPAIRVLHVLDEVRNKLTKGGNTLTKLQIEYMKALEQGRTNKARETIDQSTLDETVRSNRAKEAFNLSSLSETGRHNIATEQQAERDRLERIRSAKATDATRRAELQETGRANQAKEAENYRSNVARENENIRSNTAREVENTRSAKAREAIDIAKNVIATGEAAERIRHNMAMEAKDMAPKVTVAPSSVVNVPKQGSTPNVNVSVGSNNRSTKVDSERPTKVDSDTTSNDASPSGKTSIRDWTLNLGLFGKLEKSLESDGNGKASSHFKYTNPFGGKYERDNSKG